MDPVTAFGVATTAYKTIVAGFKVGKQVESMSKDFVLPAALFDKTLLNNFI